MRIIKVIICIICLTESSVLPAQVPGKSAAPAGKLLTGQAAARGGADAAGLTARLQAQVQRSYRQALRVQQKYPDVGYLGGPSKNFVGPRRYWQSLVWLEPTDIYPGVSFLSAQQIPAYFLIQHNLRLREWLPVLDERSHMLTVYKDELEKYRVAVTHPLHADMRWLADRVTEKTKYFLIGERHGFAEITNAIATFMLSLRLKYPNREIILLTEFLPENKYYYPAVPKDLYDNKRPVWNAAEVTDIPVVGLEPEYVTDSREVTLECANGPGCREQRAAWASLEGIRLRNERWMRVIKKYREKYPHALFVVYSGGGHVNYTEPYSLGRQLVGENTLVAMVYPRTYKRRSGELTTIVDDFDWLTEGRFPQRVLWFTNPAATWLTGFDIRIKIPVSHKKD